MKPGTPNFVGARLREAREARGLTAVSLAELLGVSRQAVSQYESGAVTPHPLVMQRISRVLNLPPHFFWREVDPAARQFAPFFRSMSAATRLARLRAERKLGWLHEIVTYVRRFVELPESNIPMISVPKDPTEITDDSIEQAATELRRQWGLGDGVVSNLVRLLERNGIIVSRIDLGNEQDGLSDFGADGSAYVILGSTKGSACRSRFDAAHELGHLVLHRNVDRRRLRNSADFRLLEQQAHDFAGAFLLPSTTFAKDLFTLSLDWLLALKEKWRCSVGAMLKRIEKLEIVSGEQSRRLWMSYSARGWRRREPLDDSMTPEEPRLLRSSFELIIGEGVRTRADILESLPFTESDIEELAGLPSGFMAEPSLTASLIDSHKVIPLSEARRKAGKDPRL